MAAQFPQRGDQVHPIAEEPEVHHQDPALSAGHFRKGYERWICVMHGAGNTHKGRAGLAGIGHMAWSDLNSRKTFSTAVASRASGSFTRNMTRIFASCRRTP